VALSITLIRYHALKLGPPWGVFEK